MCSCATEITCRKWPKKQKKHTGERMDKLESKYEKEKLHMQLTDWESMEERMWRTRICRHPVRMAIPCKVSMQLTLPLSLVRIHVTVLLSTATTYVRIDRERIRIPTPRHRDGTEEIDPCLLYLGWNLSSHR